MNVYKYVADIWEQNLDSPSTITVNAGWEALTCTSTTAVLGSAAPWNIWHDFPGGVAGHLVSAGAGQQAGRRRTSPPTRPDDGSGYGNVDIKTQFNINLGNTVAWTARRSTSAWTAMPGRRSTSSRRWCTNWATAWASRC